MNGSVPQHSRLSRAIGAPEVQAPDITSLVGRASRHNLRVIGERGVKSLKVGDMLIVGVVGIEPAKVIRLALPRAGNVGAGLRGDGGTEILVEDLEAQAEALDNGKLAGRHGNVNVLFGA